MKKNIYLLSLLVIVFLCGAITAPDIALASQPHQHELPETQNDGEEPAVLTVVAITVTVVGIGVGIWSILEGPDPIAETYAWADAGYWCCGASGSGDDEAYFPDVIAESEEGPFPCTHAARAYAYVKAWWEEFGEDSDRLVGKVDHNLFTYASRCEADAEGEAKFQGSTEWRDEEKDSEVQDSLHLQARFYFDEFSLTALNDPDQGIYGSDTANIVAKVAWDTDTLIVFEGGVINTGDGYEATGDFADLDLILDENGTLTFGTWPDTMTMDFYIPDSTVTTTSADVDTKLSEYGPVQCDVCPQVDMIPDNYPVDVPPGGEFGLTGIIVNPDDEPMITDIWVGVNFQGEFYELWDFSGTFVDIGQTLDAHLVQQVPNYAPTGTYDYIAFCGEKSNVACDTAMFDFNVIGAPRNGGSSDWTLSGGWNSQQQAETPNAMSMESYPNPFNASANIRFNLPSDTNVKLSIYNLLGQEVETLADSYMQAGYHSVNWDASGYSSGLYFYRLRAGDKVIAKQITLLK
ncbi:MAG: T9SS type A sorting domain-containing protein [candidate division Zixibacteria bacterium]|nr:T9SS type A sorting domain-containing protein [candidate division Zixibacteria bacterium]